MDKGRIAAEGPIATLKQPKGRIYELRVRTTDGAAGVAAFADRVREAGFECHLAEDESMRVFVPGEGRTRVLFELAAAQQAQVRHLRASVTTLEDVFLTLTGHSIRD